MELGYFLIVNFLLLFGGFMAVGCAIVPFTHSPKRIAEVEVEKRSGVDIVGDQAESLLHFQAKIESRLEELEQRISSLRQEIAYIEKSFAGLYDDLSQIARLPGLGTDAYQYASGGSHNRVFVPV